MRRMTREKVLAAKSNTSTLTVDDLGLPTTATIDRITIYSHITPKLQELLHATKDRQKSLGEGSGGISSQDRFIYITPAEINN